MRHMAQTKSDPHKLVTVKIPHATRRLAKIRAADMGISLAGYIALVIATEGVDALVRRYAKKA